MCHAITLCSEIPANAGLYRQTARRALQDNERTVSVENID